MIEKTRNDIISLLQKEDRLTASEIKSRLSSKGDYKLSDINRILYLYRTDQRGKFVCERNGDSHPPHWKYVLHDDDNNEKSAKPSSPPAARGGDVYDMIIMVDLGHIRDSFHEIDNSHQNTRLVCGFADYRYKYTQLVRSYLFVPVFFHVYGHFTSIWHSDITGTTLFTCNSPVKNASNLILMNEISRAIYERRVDKNKTEIYVVGRDKDFSAFCQMIRDMGYKIDLLNNLRDLKL